MTAQVVGMISALGGKNNIIEVDNCLTRLRVDVKKLELVQREKFVEYGAVGSVIVGKQVQVILGYQTADYRKGLEHELKKGDDLTAVEMLGALGGRENIQQLDACMTRLRVDVKSLGLVDKIKLNQLGASGVVLVGQQVQVILGARASDYRDALQILVS